MKKQHYKNLRYCEKIRETQCFIEADGLQKKIRDKLDKEDVYDAENKMREIDCFWKKGWEYNRTHHTFIEPKVTVPHVFLEANQHCSPKLTRYYQTLSKFISKLKIEHEDETTYRIDLHQKYPYSLEQFSKECKQSERTASRACEHLLKVFSYVNGQMRSYFQQEKSKASELMLEQNDPTHKVYMEFFHNICDRIIEAKPNQQFYDRKRETVTFTSFFIDLIMAAKEKPMFSAVVAVQPFLGELTYLLHPFCFALYGLYAHETLIKQAMKLRGKCYQEQAEKPLELDFQNLPFPYRSLLQIEENFRAEEYRHSRIIFLNLDGYESQFTLQFLRQYHEHVMYISFPKFSSCSQDEIYNKRFYKKIMFNYSKPESQLFEWQYGPDTLTLQKEQFLENPENYYETIETLYGNYANAEQMPDINQNIYVYPIRMDNLKSNKQPPEQQRNIEPHESNFIRFLMRDHLYSEMHKFKAKTIIVSYSGRIHLDNQHFTEMMQEMSKVCTKIIFFPNFTTTLVKEQMTYYYDNYEAMSAYDKVYTDIGNHLLDLDNPTTLEEQLQQYYQETGSNPWEVDLMDKLSIMLKVTSGNYNLNLPYQQESLSDKYKNTQMFPYLIHLFDALKKEYKHCEKRVERSSLEASLENIQRSIHTYIKDLEESVPPYYVSIFRQIDKLLKDRNRCFKEERDKYSDYELLVLELYDREVGDSGDTELLMRQWRQFRMEQCLDLANAKYHEFSYVQLQTLPSCQEYEDIDSDNGKMNNMNNLYKLSFCLKEHNTELLKIYQQTTLHYNTLQNFKEIQDFCLLLINVLNLPENNYENYAARPKMGKEEQRCYVKPILFKKEGAVIEQKPFTIWNEWNYTETEHFIILYWPQSFDFIAYYLHQLIRKKYEPVIQPDIYVCHKIKDFAPKAEHAVFHLLTLPQELEVIPRWGCSAFALEDQIFIFGGFHDREKSYLELQNQISTLDLTDFRPDSYEPRKIFNLRKELYCGQVFEGHLREHRIPSSFVRPRMEFEFYDVDYLTFQPSEKKEKMQQQGRQFIKKIIMIGGYGQNFRTPYSLFVNHYYQLLFDTFNRRLLSISKKMVYKRTLPVNVKAMIRNRGVFNSNNLLIQDESHEDKTRRVKEGITNSKHYFAHRIVYQLSKGELKAKIKNSFALEQYSMSKKNIAKFLEMMGGVRKVEGDPDPLSIRRLEGDNQHLWASCKGKDYLYSLYLQQEDGDVPLSNQSIVSLDTKKYCIFALISHPIYTKGKTILTSNNLPDLDPSLHANNQHLALTLKPVHVFEKNINLHCLISCNLNQMVMLQGLALEGNTCPEYFMKIKGKNEMRKEEVMPRSVPIEEVHSIHTFFLRKNNIVTAFNLIRSDQHLNEVAAITQTLDLQKFKEGWKEVSTVSPIVFVHHQEQLVPSFLQLRVEGTNFDSLELKVTTQNKSMKRHYSVLFSRLANNREVEVEQVQGQRENVLNSKGVLPSSIKTADKYEDYLYFGQ